MASDKLESVVVSSTDHPLYEEITEACRTVYDPDVHVNIYDMGLIYTIQIAANRDVLILMTLTSPGCPVAGEMPKWVSEAVSQVQGTDDVDVRLVWEPPWGLDMMGDEVRLEFGLL